MMETPDTTFTIEARVIGQRNMLQPGWQIALPAIFSQEQSAEVHPPFLLRDLIVYIVHSEVQSFRQRQQERRLLRVLAPQEIMDAAVGGKIVTGGPSNSVQSVDEQAASAVALQAFEDGLYLVFLNGVPQYSLEHEIMLMPRSTVTFIRLVALVGG